MATLKGSKTEKNLLSSFAGESQARNRYTYFASQARKEGFEQVAWIFSETAENEKEHAKRFFKFLEGGDAEIVAAFPAGVIGSAADNLKAAAAGEHHEYMNLYPQFAEVADAEGFKEVADVFRNIAMVEREHEKRYLKLLNNVLGGKVFKKDGAVKWRCRNCGFVHDGMDAPDICPACAHPQAHYELLAENY
jgi:rubrerythrin